MKRATQLVFALFFILSLCSVLSGKDETIFEQLHEKILQSMPENSLFILAATPECYRFGFCFQQNSDLFYFTGTPNEADIDLLKPGMTCADMDAIVKFRDDIKKLMAKKNNFDKIYSEEAVKEKSGAGFLKKSFFHNQK